MTLSEERNLTVALFLAPPRCCQCHSIKGQDKASPLRKVVRSPTPFTLTHSLIVPTEPKLLPVTPVFEPPCYPTSGTAVAEKRRRSARVAPAPSATPVTCRIFNQFRAAHTKLPLPLLDRQHKTAANEFHSFPPSFPLNPPSISPIFPLPSLLFSSSGDDDQRRPATASDTVRFISVSLLSYNNYFNFSRPFATSTPYSLFIRHI
jgi:hypothetical protein